MQTPHPLQVAKRAAELELQRQQLLSRLEAAQQQAAAAGGGGGGAGEAGRGTIGVEAWGEGGLHSLGRRVSSMRRKCTVRIKRRARNQGPRWHQRAIWQSVRGPSFRRTAGLNGLPACISHLYLPPVSPTCISHLYLPCISHLYLPPVSPLYLPCISNRLQAARAAPPAPPLPRR